ncbi:diguanylate cyclase (GGDEF)-like protein [Amycolatopsis bartoniae]|uniref:GGDEF domain-containing protein n=1 Tax=Amycolatopsis bartoniae TaxID=941986 RepID=A0A8H9MEJ5_9PSEU|nr:GGDEF domain-containing protein [Amycolatopsis bartoniae]MBB2933572.1 diguanylate cyclase (GGDEF)-like protein [Amycolatopsis bartoniae]TVT10751.1 EAL domain-containing protein [Amycolatopsis bartoniae]GHF73207.1 GGDEF domain-containing protein [Amycolatopsis bartoniae]
MEVAVEQVSFAFQPVYNLHTGGVIGVEALARPAKGKVQDLLRHALRRGRLVAVDAALAARALLAEPSHETLLPLHVNLTAASAAAPQLVLDPLLEALGTTGRRTREIVLEVGSPFHGVPAKALLAGVRRFTELGFRIAFDNLGHGDLPLNLLAEARPHLMKLDRTTLHRLPDDQPTVALVEALCHFAARADVRLVATGVETEAQLETVRRLGIRLVQGNLFAPAREGTVPAAGLASVPPAPAARTATNPRVDDFLRAPATLPADATCDQVRKVLLDQDAPTGIVGVDAEGRPAWSVDRSRFLLDLTGPFGHALHANRPAARLADPPRTIRSGAGALELLDLVTDAELDRSGDDVIVVDAEGRCVGVVLVHELVRGVAEVKIEEAAALNPLTRLPGSDAVAREVDRRLAASHPTVVGWLDIDSFKRVNDTAGFAAGDELIRAIGRALSDLHTKLPGVVVSHVGGDDFLVACDLDEITPVADALLDVAWSADGRPVTVSLATIVCAGERAQSYQEVSRMLAPLKKAAKHVRGSSWVNSWPAADRVEILRGEPGADFVTR